MKGNERREKLIELLKKSDEPVSGKTLAGSLGVSRQVVVQDITLLRAQNVNIVSTTSGYVLLGDDEISRVFKVIHADDEVEEELNLIVDMGGTVRDVFIYHKVYGTVKGEMNISNRREVKQFMESLATGKSSLLKNVTGGYHYHTVTATSMEILDLIMDKLEERGFLAELQDYEPVDFWGDEE